MGGIISDYNAKDALKWHPQYVFCFWLKVRPCRPIGVHEQCMYILFFIRFVMNITNDFNITIGYWLNLNRRLVIRANNDPKSRFIPKHSKWQSLFFSGCEAVMVFGASFCFVPCENLSSCNVAWVSYTFTSHKKYLHIIYVCYTPFVLKSVGVRMLPVVTACILYDSLYIVSLACLS